MAMKSAASVDAYLKKLDGYKTAKGTTQFTIEKPLPAALVKVRSVTRAPS